MDHAEAINNGYTEKYLLGEMSEEERLAYEEHYFDCRDCAEDLKAATALVDNAREVLSETDTAIAVLAAVAARTAWWQRLRVSSPALALAALAVTLVVSAYQAVVVIPDLRYELAEAREPQAVVWEFLSVARGNAPVVTVSPDHRLVGLRLSRSTERFYSEYRCELRDQDGRIVQSAVVPAPPPGEELELVLTLVGLRPGPYVVVLAGLVPRGGPDATPELARYHFNLRLSED